jgi:putative nucleotidyltransferase with HDIG domain
MMRQVVSMEENTASGIISDILRRNRRDYARWIPVYTGLVSVIGLLIILIAFNHLPENRVDFLLFVGLAAISEFGTVHLFRNSRNAISFSAAIAIACVPLFGPFASALIYATSGLMTALTGLLVNREYKVGNRVSWWRRCAFNTGMYVISISFAGQMYLITGGTIGNVAQWGNIFPLFVAGVSEFLVNFALLLGVIILQTGQHPSYIWRRDFQWHAPTAIVSSTIGSGLIALTYETFNISIACAVLLLIALLSYFSSRFYVSNMKDTVNELERANLRLEQSQVGLLKTIGDIIDAFDAYTFGHSAQVADYAEAIAEKMKLPMKEKELIVKAALVHDIGKIGVMDAIIGKQGPLTDEEYQLVKQHPDIGAKILQRMEGFEALVPLVRHHHERWNGSGYPLGLKGEEIPLGARILAVADSVDAMFSDRPYRSSPSYDQVMKELIRCMGTQFDPMVIQVFFAVANERGTSFFKNSAATVDRRFQFHKLPDIGENIRYLKRSMLGILEEKSQ